MKSNKFANKLIKNVRIWQQQFLFETFFFVFTLIQESINFTTRSIYINFTAFFSLTIIYCHTKSNIYLIYL